MKPILLIAITTALSPALLYAYDPCWDVPSYEKGACYVQIQDEKETRREDQRRLDAWANQINNEDQARQLREQLENSQKTGVLDPNQYPRP